MKMTKKNIAKMYKIWFVVPAVIILAAVIVFAAFAGVNHDINKGMNIGTDFAGGSIVTIVLGDGELGDDAGFNEHLDAITQVLEDDSIAEQVVQIAADEYGVTLTADAVKASVSYSQRSDTGSNMSIIVKYDNVSSTFDPNNDITNVRNELIEARLEEIYSAENGYTNASVTMSNIGATASREMVKSALLALVISLALILVYVVIRFELWSGLAAVIALCHDVAIMLAFTIMFRIQVNSSFIAAMITIVAYSINNTIVIFDRVRENNKIVQKLKPNAPLDNFAIADKSLKQTLTRCVNTTVTTLFAIVIFAILGASSVREFALPVIFGLFAGFYSSVFISPALYSLMKNAADKRKAKKRAAGTFVGQKKQQPSND